jgi:hypothetical protein
MFQVLLLWKEPGSGTGNRSDRRVYAQAIREIEAGACLAILFDDGLLIATSSLLGQESSVPHILRTASMHSPLRRSHAWQSGSGSQYGFVDQVYMVLDPVVERTFTRRGLIRWLPRVLQGEATLAIVSLNIVRADRNWLYNRCLEFLAQDRLR